jgi:HEAT repeat protein
LLRFRAARALGDIGNERAVEPLVEIAQADDYVRPAAAMALARLAPARAVLPLTRLATDDFTAEEASAALTRVLQEAAGHIAPDDLRAVVKLHAPCHDRPGAEDRTSPRRPSAFLKTVDCSQVSRLARDELTRRGLEV